MAADTPTTTGSGGDPFDAPAFRRLLVQPAWSLVSSAAAGPVPATGVSLRPDASRQPFPGSNIGQQSSLDSACTSLGRAAPSWRPKQSNAALERGH
jgi:hypothetical protein